MVLYFAVGVQMKLCNEEMFLCMYELLQCEKSSNGMKATAVYLINSLIHNNGKLCMYMWFVIINVHLVYLHAYIQVHTCIHACVCIHLWQVSIFIYIRMHQQPPLCIYSYDNLKL